MKSMKRLNNNIPIEKERELLEKLYNYLSRDVSDAEHDADTDILTCNYDSDGNDYFWFLDFYEENGKSVAIDMNGNIIDESNDSETLEDILY